MPILPFVLGIGLLAAAPAPAAAQAVFRAGIDLVSLGVTVTDRRGTLITDLQVSDFEVLEGGAPQRIEYFAAGLAEGELRPELHLGLLLDTSGSMVDDMHLARTAAIKFLNRFEEADDITLVDFDTEVRVARYGQADFPRLVERIRNRKPDGWTALYDALGVYLDGAFDQDGRKILVLYTDGDDTRSNLSFSETLDLLKASDATLYVVGLFGRQSLSRTQQDRIRLTQLAETTGGQAYFPTAVDQLDEVYQKIYDEVTARYTLGYTSTNRLEDGSWREIEIRLTRPELKGAKIRARKGYYAPYRQASGPP